VLECGVVGVPDEQHTQTVKAYVVLREGVPRDGSTVTTLQEFTRHEIAPYKCPAGHRVPRRAAPTNTGKLQRFRLRDRA
jgi:2-aminobenzoate-CoA ligase